MNNPPRIVPCLLAIAGLALCTAGFAADQPPPAPLKPITKKLTFIYIPKLVHPWYDEVRQGIEYAVQEVKKEGIDPSAFKMLAQRRSCHWDRPSAATEGSKLVPRSKSLSGKLLFLWWSMRVSVHRVTPLAEALEMGVDAVLVNTAIAAARDPVRMARAFKAVEECAREAFEAGLPSQFDHAEATSPLAAFLKESSEPGDSSRSDR